MGRGPRRYESKSPLVTTVRPKIRPQKYPLRGPIPKPNYLPHSWTRLAYDAKRHPDPIRRFSTMQWTDRRTDGPIADGPTDSQTDRSSTGKFDHCRPLRSESDAA